MDVIGAPPGQRNVIVPSLTSSVLMTEFHAHTDGWDFNCRARKSG